MGTDERRGINYSQGGPLSVRAEAVSLGYERHPTVSVPEWSRPSYSNGAGINSELSNWLHWIMFRFCSLSPRYLEVRKGGGVINIGAYGLCACMLFRTSSWLTSCVMISLHSVYQYTHIHIFKRKPLHTCILAKNIPSET